MKQKDIDKVNEFFNGWKGANASFNRYVDDHDRLILALVKPDDPDKFVGITFTYCEYLAGMTRWSNCQIQCYLYDFKNGHEGFELKDDEAGFLLRCHGPIVLGDDSQVVPQS